MTNIIEEIKQLAKGLPEPIKRLVLDICEDMSKEFDSRYNPSLRELWWYSMYCVAWLLESFRNMSYKEE